MINEWRELLASYGATIDDHDLPSFPASRPDSDCRLFDLSHLGLIAVHGADAKSFLQGQLTNDVRELSDSYTHLSGHCSHKGRMLAIFRSFQRGDTLYLQTPAERVPDITKRLSMFVLRSKVSVRDASDELIRLGIAGARAPNVLAEVCSLTVPEPAQALATTGDITLIRLPGSTPRLEVIGPPAAMIQLWQRLAQHAAPANLDDWKLLEIQAGQPNVYNATADAFVPQMVNLHLVEGVSFNKGCYTGQEVVARMQFLGKLKRRMYLAETESETAPQPGDELFSSASTSQQTSGRVVDVAPLSPGRYALLVVAEVTVADSGEARLGASDGPALTLTEPPYGFSPEQEASGAG